MPGRVRPSQQKMHTVKFGLASIFPGFRIMLRYAQGGRRSPSLRNVADCKPALMSIRSELFTVLLVAYLGTGLRGRS